MKNFSNYSQLPPFIIKYGSLFILCVVALYIRLPEIPLTTFRADEPLYSWYTNLILQNPLSLFSYQLNEFHPPLFALILAIAGIFYPKGLLAFRLVALLINITGIIFTYFLELKIKNRFVGFLAALLLCFNYLYSPLAICVLILIFFLSFINGTSPLRDHISVGILVSACFLLKCSGLMVIPIVFIYYLFLPDTRSLRMNLKLFGIPLFVFLTTATAILLSNAIHTGTLWPYYTSDHLFISTPLSFFYYLRNQHQIFIYLPFCLSCIMDLQDFGT